MDRSTKSLLPRASKWSTNPTHSPSGTKQLARSDFSKDWDKLTLEQATLVMVDKGYVVSFTFIGSSQDEVDGLLEGLRFLAAHRLAGAACFAAQKVAFPFR